MRKSKNFRSILFFVATIITVTACSSDSSSSSNSSAGVSFKVDGNATTLEIVQATLYTNTVAGGRYIDIYGFQGTDQVLEFHFPAKIGDFAAQQSFDMTTSWLTYLTNDGANYPGDYFNSTSGTINVTTCDTINNKIVATFNFVGSNTTVNKTITEGSLNISGITHQ